MAALWQKAARETRGVHLWYYAVANVVSIQRAVLLGRVAMTYDLLLTDAQIVDSDITYHCQWPGADGA
jgi:hypothetical protein